MQTAAEDKQYSIAPKIAPKTRSPLTKRYARPACVLVGPVRATSELLESCFAGLHLNFVWRFSLSLCSPLLSFFVNMPSAQAALNLPVSSAHIFTNTLLSLRTYRPAWGYVEQLC